MDIGKYSSYRKGITVKLKLNDAPIIPFLVETECFGTDVYLSDPASTLQVLICS